MLFIIYLILHKIHNRSWITFLQHFLNGLVLLLEHHFLPFQVFYFFLKVVHKVIFDILWFPSLWPHFPFYPLEDDLGYNAIRRHMGYMGFVRIWEVQKEQIALCVIFIYLFIYFNSHIWGKDILYRTLTKYIHGEDDKIWGNITSLQDMKLL